MRGLRRFPGPEAVRILEELRDAVPECVTRIALTASAGQTAELCLTLVVTDDVARTLSRALAADREEVPR